MIAQREATHFLEAFGLAVECDWPLPGSRPLAGDVSASTRVSRMSAEQFLAEWDRPSELIFEPEYPDGKKRVRIERSDSHYLLWFDVYGRFVVSVDGSEVGCEAHAERAPQERIIFAQLLPLAAVLRGFEVLHGAAVVAGEGVAAFLGSSGIGKTTLASRLLLRGAELVTDDVLALELTPSGLIAHPGPAMMVVLEDDEGTLPGPALGRTDKTHVSVPTAGRPLPLSALYYMEPGETFELTAVDEPDVQRLLGSMFVPYLTTPERLRRHLETAQLLGEAVDQFRLQIPRTSSFEDVLDSVESHLKENAG